MEAWEKTVTVVDR